MNNEVIRNIEKSGTTISKEKLIESIRKSNNKQFKCVVVQNGRGELIVLIPA